jgi:hypothetical protein
MSGPESCLNVLIDTPSEMISGDRDIKKRGVWDLIDRDLNRFEHWLIDPMLG